MLTKDQSYLHEGSNIQCSQRIHPIFTEDPSHLHKESVPSSWRISLSLTKNWSHPHGDQSHLHDNQSMRQRRWALRAFLSRVRSLPRLKMWVLESTVSVLPSRLEACVTISTVFTAHTPGKGWVSSSLHWIYRHQEKAEWTLGLSEL